MIILSAILGAFFNRLRGGLVDAVIPNKVPNIVWKLINAIVFGSLMGYSLNSLYVIPAAIAGMFLGAMFKWRRVLTAVIDHDNLKFFLPLAMLRGLLWTACIALSIMFFKHQVFWYIPVGLLFPLPYYLISFTVKDTTKGWAMAEYIWGAILWASLIAIIG